MTMPPVPHGDTLWLWTDTLTMDGAAFNMLDGDVLQLEITHASTGTVTLRTATFTAGSNAVSYRPVADDVAAIETLHLRWKITRGGFIGHIPTNGWFDLPLI